MCEERNKDKISWKKRIAIAMLPVIIFVILNATKAILIDVGYYKKIYNSYVHRFYYDDRNMDLYEQIDSIKKVLNIEDRSEKVMISPSDYNNVIMVVFSYSYIYNIGFYDFDIDKVTRDGYDMNEYLKSHIIKDRAVLYEKISPNEVFFLVAPESEAMPMNYLLWESPSYEIATSILGYSGMGNVRVIGDSEYIEASSDTERNISYKKTLKSIVHHTMKDFDLSILGN